VKKVKVLLAVISPILLLTSCAGGNSGFDAVGLTKNPVIMILVFIATLYIAFKMRSR